MGGNSGLPTSERKLRALEQKLKEIQGLGAVSGGAVILRKLSANPL
jgi:hypothetical protein